MIEALYSVHREPLLRYCIVMCRDMALAEDIVHNTFMRAMAHIGDLMEMNAPQVRSWLYKTARNLFYDHVRRAAVAAETEKAVSEEVKETGYDETEVCMVLDQLPYDLRDLFSKRYIEGYTSSDISKMYGIPPATVRGKLMKARKMLKEYFQED